MSLQVSTGVTPRRLQQVILRDYAFDGLTDEQVRNRFTSLSIMRSAWTS